MSLVIFDLDETMIHGDCSSLWSQRMASLGWVDESFVRHDAELMEQ
ncbi:HAD-IB family hydrolase, partial [Escherichia coli]|nr:HAD-IB family hydrolase [Escherichia coli]